MVTLSRGEIAGCSKNLDHKCTIGAHGVPTLHATSVFEIKSVVLPMIRSANCVNCMHDNDNVWVLGFNFRFLLFNVTAFLAYGKSVINTV